MRRSKGFTLTEIFIVIAIILILLAILIPAVQGAWELARLVQCQSNMRQLIIGMQNFAAVHDGRMPGGLDDPQTLEWLGNPSSLNGTSLSNLWRVPQEGALWQFIGDESAYLCPKMPSASIVDGDPGPPWGEDAANAGYGNGRFSYSIPLALAGAPLSLITKLKSKYENPSGTWHNMDAPVLIEEGEVNIAWVSAEGHWHGGPPPDACTDRHTGGCNLGFVDGRVELFLWTELHPTMSAATLLLVTPEGEFEFGNAPFGGWANPIDKWMEEN